MTQGRLKQPSAEQHGLIIGWAATTQRPIHPCLPRTHIAGATTYEVAPGADRKTLYARAMALKGKR